MKRILIAAGGSGGHIFPAIALGRSLKALDKNIDIMYVGSRKDLDRRIFEKELAQFKALSANKLSHKMSLGEIVVFFKLLSDMARAISIVLTYKPDVAVGFGGYVSFPIICAGKLAGVSTIVHEQNVTPGRANKLLFMLAKKIAVSFEETVKAIGGYAGKCALTGNPIRSEILKIDRSIGVKRFGLDEGKFTLLVIGGSQGAAFLNRAFVGAISAMDVEARRRVQVIHITGVKDYEWALHSYEGLGIDFRVHSFVDRIEEAYSAADLVVTRSGASVISELAFLRKPMILVPYPFAMSHQLDNALVFSRRGAAILIGEKDLNPAILAGSISGLMNDPKAMRGLSDASGALAHPEASDNLAKEVIALAGI